MDEDLAIINTNTRNERIKNFFINNQKRLIIFFTLIIFFVLLIFGYNEFKKRERIKISNLYNSTIIEHSSEKKNETKNLLLEIIEMRDPTYSPLSLYFIIDNKLISDHKTINNLFNLLIEKTSLEKEIKNLIIYKKALYNASISQENELLKILNPLINSQSVWKSHALYLMAEFYYSKNEMQKSKEFFDKLISLNNANQNLKKEAQKRLSRDLSD
jgi:predicted negative regulator of RcsB-dependent stress response|tara:strand:+ start:69 stop:713 length:645 start_codon:yes stop_codon:yes gene_type:complete